MLGYSSRPVLLLPNYDPCFRPETSVPCAHMHLQYDLRVIRMMHKSNCVLTDGLIVSGIPDLDS